LVINLQKAIGVASRSLKSSNCSHVQWFITRRCNYRCRGCNVWRRQDNQELSTEEIKRGLDILRELGVIEVVLSGGNPLLRGDIGEIIDYASRFFITTVYDNGSMAAEKVDDLHNADLVAISIDSLNPQKNDYIKGVEGAWKKSVASVKRLLEEGVSVCVSPTISQLNMYEILDLTEYFTNRGIPIWYCLYSSDPCDRYGQIFEIGKKMDEFTISDQEGLVKLCDSLLEKSKENQKILMTNRVLKAIRELYSEGRRTWRCEALHNFFVIDHLGRVAGCHLHNPVASIFDLPKIWKSSKFNKLREKYRKCIKCTYLCYIFYSLHEGVLGNLQIAREQWKNMNLIVNRGLS